MTDPLRGNRDSVPGEFDNVRGDRCPWCEDEGKDVTGKADPRFMSNGRRTFICPENGDHRWQDMRELIDSGKGAVRIR